MSVTSLCEWRKKQGDRSSSKSPLTQNTVSEKLGQTLTDEDSEHIAAVYAVIIRAKMNPFTTKSDFARTWASHVALAASEGFITTRVNDDKFSNVWMVTANGLDWVSEVEDVLRD